MHGLLIHGPIKYIDHQEEEEDARDKVEKPQKFSDSTLQAGGQSVGDIFHDSRTATRLFAGAKRLVPTFDTGMVFKDGRMAIFPLHKPQVEHIQSISIASEWRVLPLRCHVLFSSPPLGLQTIRYKEAMLLGAMGAKLESSILLKNLINLYYATTAPVCSMFAVFFSSSILKVFLHTFCAPTATALNKSALRH